jgi:hypothetical protein
MLELNDTVWATLGPSKIHGIGVVAIRDIPKGIEFTDYRYPSYKRKSYPFESFEMLEESIQNLLIDRIILTDQTRSVYSPNSDQDLRAYMNHSDHPNTDGVRTIRKINKGEELTENYKDIAQGEMIFNYPFIGGKDES